ncbi:MAG: hypothetical protein KBE04_05795 [Phycisphaerae bacterium]|nr:hypothetical protein [Phycisphaerae bacterium]
MKTLAMILGIVALALTVVPPILFANQSMTEPTMKRLMLDGCVLWFVTAPAFMKGGAQ